ncbi:GNAT family N-acetyltransferase [Streptomyces sp. NPDC088785]|uniref:GNAT family N-acetyltransferase n=1 Tax=Streptomyces sp. NPDC088785 TaxID=3365897 RepID=UPI00381595DF
MTDIVIDDDRAAGFLRARVGGAEGELAGHLQYFVLEEPRRALVAVHTVVPPAHEGKGVGGSLARALYATAAREAIAVVPLCSFVVRWAARHPGEAPQAPGALVDAARAAVADRPELW